MKYYGQFETDKIIETYFPNQTKGLCIEVGAYDGIKGSNTKYFDDLGWETICIEPNPNIFKLLEQNRPNSININCAAHDNFGVNKFYIYKFHSGIESSLSSLKTDPRLVVDYDDAIQEINIVNVLSIPLHLMVANLKEIDFISIDTEGTELDVLKGLDLTENRPRLLVVENNYEDKDISFFMAKYGYELDQRYKINDFYVPA